MKSQIKNTKKKKKKKKKKIQEGKIIRGIVSAGISYRYYRTPTGLRNMRRLNELRRQ